MRVQNNSQKQRRTLVKNSEGCVVFKGIWHGRVLGNIRLVMTQGMKAIVYENDF